MGTENKGNIPESFVNHGQKIVKVYNLRPPVTSTPIYTEVSDGLCHRIQDIKQNLIQVFKHEQEIYDNPHANYLNFLGCGFHEGMKSLMNLFEIKAENLRRIRDH